MKVKKDFKHEGKLWKSVSGDEMFLTDRQKALIEIGLQQLNADEGISAKKAMPRIRKKYKLN